MALKRNLIGELVAEFILCEGRHECPVKESIFPSVVPVLAFGKLELEAENILFPLKQQGLKKLVIYVTGCTSALIAVINAAQRLHVRDIVLMHYDSVNNGYQPQHLVTYTDMTWE